MKAAAPIALLLVLVVFPLIGGDFYINLASQMFIAALFATSLNLLVGYGGLVSLGHASWIRLAAYTSAWLYLRLGLGHWISAPLALVNTTLIAGIFGANTALPGGNDAHRWLGFEFMFGAMAVGALTVFVLLKYLRRRNESEGMGPPSVVPESAFSNTLLHVWLESAVGDGVGIACKFTRVKNREPTGVVMRCTCGAKPVA